MPPLSKKQQKGVYEKLVRQDGSGNNLITIPVFRPNLSRIQDGSGFFRNMYNKLKRGAKTLEKHVGNVPRDIVKDVGNSVMQDVKDNAVGILTGTKSVGDVINPKHILDKTMSAVTQAARHRLTSTPSHKQYGTGEKIYVVPSYSPPPKRKKRKHKHQNNTTDDDSSDSNENEDNEISKPKKKKKKK